MPTEGSSPGRKDRVNPQADALEIVVLSQPRIVVQAEHCSVLWSPVLALLITTTFSHVHSIQLYLSPGFQVRFLGKFSRGGLVG